MIKHNANDIKSNSDGDVYPNHINFVHRIQAGLHAKMISPCGENYGAYDFEPSLFLVTCKKELYTKISKTCISYATVYFNRKREKL